MAIRLSFTPAITGLTAGLAALTAGAVTGIVPIAIAGGAIAAATVLASGLAANSTGAKARARLPAAEQADAARAVAQHHTGLAALAYAWAASGFATVYLLSDLVWYHAYQYGLGALIGAVGLGLMARKLDGATAQPPAAALTALHGLAAGGGLAFLIGTGKVWSTRSDWPGNVIFTSGGIAIVALCVIAIAAHRALKR